MQRKRLAGVLGLWLALMAVGTTNVSAAIEIAGNGLTQTVACAEQNVVLCGFSNTITLTGACPRLDVTGRDNTVLVEAVGRIEITGTSNSVGWGRSLAGTEPRLALTGLGNQVFQAEVPAPEPTAPEPVLVEVTVLNLVDSGRQMTFDCADGLLNLMGSGNVLTLTGTCQHLNVLGSNNQIWVQRALAIDVLGSLNAVTWEGAFGDGSPPAVAIVGTDSTVTQGTMP
jgi:hypothetical protein